ncbi:HAD-IA family hydrolase [Marinicrinis lubricantis]|uniref:HAD-IA family hydrolase n=1 Tax=Marinicrinis lubricantis TaxID=2086470 RepID=A0ABW1IR46_9BACL
MGMRKSLASYQAVFLDAGDTLITTPDSYKAFKTCLDGKGLKTDEREVRKLLAAAIERYYYRKEKDEYAVCSPDSDRNYWIGIYEAVLSGLGAQQYLETVEIVRLCNELYELFVSPELYVLFEDVLPALERFSREGYRLGIVSNFAPTLHDILRHLNVLHYFDPIIVSTEVGLEKPNPAMFRLALEQAKLEGTDVLFVGDHEVNDIWAAERAGMDAVQIVRYPDQSGEGEIIHTLIDLFTIGGQIREYG